MLEYILSKIAVNPTEVIFDGKIHRFGKKDSAWYVGHQWVYKNYPYQKVIFGDFKNGEGEHIWTSYDKTLEKEKEFSKTYQKQSEENTEKLRLEKERMHISCADKWKPIYSSAKSGLDHDYLNYKGVKNYSAKVDQRGSLLIGMYDHEKFVGTQNIFKDSTGEFQKRFSTGVKKKGAIHPLMPFKRSEFCYLVEGYATGSSIQEANPKIPVIVAFDSGNLVAAVNTIRFINPTIKVIICADRDKNGVGERYAKKCVSYFKDCFYVMPNFNPGSPTEWSDFNDLHNFVSIEKVKEQIAIDDAWFSFIQPLGHDEETGKYYYITSENSQVIPLAAGSHNELGFCRLIPNESYWIKNYPKKSKGDDEDDAIITVNWKKARNDLMEKSLRVGEYNPEKLRGVGVWEEKGNFVLNNGDSVFGRIEKQNFHYLKGKKIETKVENVSDERAKDLLNNLWKSFNSLSYYNKNDSIILASWIVQSYIFSVLPWRFHLWIRGSAGTGKSSILKVMESLCINPLFVANASEAGIVQDCKNNATQLIHDELESLVNGRENFLLESIMNLARRMSKNESGKKLRGTVTGTSAKYNTNLCLLFGSINTNIISEADTSRFFVVDLDSTKEQPLEKWKLIKAGFEECARDKNIMFNYIFSKIPVILKNREFIFKYLHDEYRIDSRLVDQLSTMISCVNIYRDEGIINAEDIEYFINEFDILGDKSYYQENLEMQETDDDIIHDLLNIDLDNEKNTPMVAIKILRENKSDNDDMNGFVRKMWFFGLRYIEKRNTLFIKNPKHLRSIRTKMGDVSFFHKLAKSKKCINQKAKNRFDGNLVAGIEISLDIID